MNSKVSKILTNVMVPSHLSQLLFVSLHLLFPWGDRLPHLGCDALASFLGMDCAFWSWQVLFVNICYTLCVCWHQSPQGSRLTGLLTGTWSHHAIFHTCPLPAQLCWLLQPGPRAMCFPKCRAEWAHMHRLHGLVFIMAQQPASVLEETKKLCGYKLCPGREQAAGAALCGAKAPVQEGASSSLHLQQLQEQT